MKKNYVKQINFNTYITTLATHPGSPICKVISRWSAILDVEATGPPKHRHQNLHGHHALHSDELCHGHGRHTNATLW
jgi:hypothetical protein